MEQCVQAEEVLSPYEAAFLDGFMDCSALSARRNPHPTGTIEADGYDHGYNRSLEETGI